MTKFFARMMLLALGLAALLTAAGCGGKQVTRVDVEEDIDLSGEWNDVDSRKVSAALTAQITMNSWVEDFMAENGNSPGLSTVPRVVPTKQMIVVDY